MPRKLRIDGSGALHHILSENQRFRARSWQLPQGASN